MISDIAIYSSVASVATAAGIYALQHWRATAPENRVVELPVEVGPKSLDDPHIRHRMTEFLSAHRIVGDADIREGKFLPVVTPERLGPLETAMSRAYSRVQRLRNPNACSLYVRDSVGDRFMLLDELDVSDIGEILRLVQRVAADRKRTRKMFADMTPAEIDAIARKAISNWLQSNGQFEQSRNVNRGDYSGNMRDMVIAREVLLEARLTLGNEKES